MKKVQFHYQDIKLTIRNKNEIKRFVEKIFITEKKDLDKIHYIFCTDEYLLTINRQYLKHDYYTDIITFDLSENENKIIGEIYISLDRIADNANSINEPLYNETLRVIFHGALHLCGYKDKNEKDEKIMRKMEDKYISLFTNSST
ncbi:MAG: rRNA maturation RNase YbeY [Arachidicoccus sp.]|nr:rRNA maturation RNase YbeY [Arachidicoccus sp.]